MRTVPRSEAATLSPRQSEIAELLRSGKSSREIGALLSIDPRTVDVHVHAICNKLGVRTRVEIVVALARSRADAQPAYLTPRRTNLPLQVMSFVGRETEIAEIKAWLGQHRLVTLTGSGGVGKTRTSLQVAANTGGSGDGVWFIELGALSSGDYVPTTIAQVVGVPLDANGDPLDQLVAALKAKNMLLVFDNCEHLIAASARIVSALINSCPRVTILCSSRQALGIVGEATYRMPSLPVPPTGTAAEVNAESALQYAAVRLFVERAKAVNNRFQLTDENGPSVTDICRRLDGIALAIELAAAWVKILSPQQLCNRLDDRFRLLTGGGRDRLRRHQTLRALIDWSHALLDEGEQRLFRRMSIFANGFTFDAALAVGGDEVDGSEVFDLMASLVDKSLVMADPNGDAERYRLLESTRVYAAEKLVGAGEREAVASRHLRYLRDLFVEALSRRERTGRTADLDSVLAGELEDVRAALDRAAASEPVTGGELLAAIVNRWLSIGLEREGITYLERFIALLPDEASLLTASLWTSLSRLVSARGQYDKALEMAAKAVRFAIAIGDSATIAYALLAYSSPAAALQKLDEAAAALGKAETLAPADRLFLRIALMYSMARLSHVRGNLEQAAQAYRDLQKRHRSLGNDIEAAQHASNAAEIQHALGHTETAIAIVQEELPRVRAGRSSWYILILLCNLAGYLVSLDRIEESRSAAHEALRVGSAHDPDNYNVTYALEHLALGLALGGSISRAAQLAGYAQAALHRMGFYEREFTEQKTRTRLEILLRDHLAPAELAELSARGAALTVDDAIALGLEDDP